MAPANSQRIKGKRISRDIIIGSEAIPLPEPGDPKRDPSIPIEHRYSWTIYVRTLPDGPTMSAWCQKLTFRLHESYRDTPGGSNRTLEAPPYEVRATGWGGFMVDIKFHFVPAAGEKAATRSHYLQLEPYGTEEMVERQKREGRVVSESLEIIEFNEPTEALWDALTSEDQWDHLKPRGKGAKGRASFGGFGVLDGEGSVALPAKSSKGNEFSREREEVVLHQMAGQNETVLRKNQEMVRRKEELERELRELQASGDVPAPARKR